MPKVAKESKFKKVTSARPKLIFTYFFQNVLGNEKKLQVLFIVLDQKKINLQKRNFIEHKYFIRRHKTYKKARNQIQRLLLHKSALSFFISKNAELLIYVRCINENG